MINLSQNDLWAKTTLDGRPGISVRDHGLNVGCVAEALMARMPVKLKGLLPAGSITLAALHDIGKISTGFLRKCEYWLVQNNLAQRALEEFWQGAESDHSVVSQACLQEVLKHCGAELWAVAVGAHHGRIHGRRIGRINQTPQQATFEHLYRQHLIQEFCKLFGPLPDHKPLKSLDDLWLLAGLIAVADWIGSNEMFFATGSGLTLEQARKQAADSLASINWSGGDLLEGKSFQSMFDLSQEANTMQAVMKNAVSQPGLIIVEGPMGCGKTEAALLAAYDLITSKHNEGIYFGLPTQVTSNRIHRRVGRFLSNTLADPANFRLAHSASWLDSDQVIEIHPAASDAECGIRASETRSWFASARHALLARYGVGTIDQALQGVVAVKHFFVRRFGLAGKVVILDEVHSYDVYTGALITQLVRELLALQCSVIILSATLTRARRQELLRAAGTVPSAKPDAQANAPDAHPLVTVATTGQPVRSLPLAWTDQKHVRLRAAPLTEQEIIAECLARAEAGQHVLYLRNTVAQAQSTYRAFASAARAETVRLGLLHSRFPFFRREELEEEWLERLGKDRAQDGPGSLLVATQVVEQSVDIDLDFIVSDLAPTDMLLQRMGRLWRHPRLARRAMRPEFWINVPAFEGEASAGAIKSALGKTGRVYAPYVLMRTAEVFIGRDSITLPLDIRQILEATYADRAGDREPTGWRDLREELLRDKQQLENEAMAAMLVLGRPSQADREEVLTRRGGAPMRPVVLLRTCEPFNAGVWRLIGLDGSAMEASGRNWRHATAKTLHRNLVRTPKFAVPRQTSPPWLSLHMPAQTAWAIVQPDGRCFFPDAAVESSLAYDPRLGLFSDSSKPQPRDYDPEDNEFDN